MVGVARLPSANETWLGSHKTQVRLIAPPLRFGQGEHALVDFAGRRRVGSWGERQRLRLRKQLFAQRWVLMAAIVTRRPWNGRRVVRVKPEAGRRPAVCYEV